MAADGGTGQVAADTPAEPDSISAFVARVLNQLTLSAWLPGAFLVSGVAVLNQFRMHDSLSLDGAARAVAASWVPLVILALPTLVMATLLTQAFSFEAIRTLEGYWRRRGPATWLRTAMTWRQLQRKRSLARRLIAARHASFAKVRPALLKRADGLVVLALEADIAHQERPSGLSDVQDTAADEFEWWNLCAPWDTARFLRLSRDLDDFPVDSRVMPTKLGNVLRSAEDRLTYAGDDLEGFALRNRLVGSPRVMLQHDQFRNRLDMYCTLTFVAAVLSALSVIMLWRLGWAGVWPTLAVFLALAWAGYGAAIASARGYCTALRAIDQAAGTPERAASS